TRRAGLTCGSDWQEAGPERADPPGPGPRRVGKKDEALPVAEADADGPGGRHLGTVDGHGPDPRLHLIQGDRLDLPLAEGHQLAVLALQGQLGRVRPQLGGQKAVVGGRAATPLDVPRTVPRVSMPVFSSM